MISIEQIRRAILAHHGGLDGASDAQIERIWAALDEPTQRRYLEAIGKKGEKTDAISHRPDRDD